MFKEPAYSAPRLSSATTTRSRVCQLLLAHLAFFATAACTSNEPSTDSSTLGQAGADAGESTPPDSTQGDGGPLTCDPADYDSSTCPTQSWPTPAGPRSGICTLDHAAVGRPLTIEYQQPGGRQEFGSALRCTVSIDGQDVRVSFARELCGPSCGRFGAIAYDIIASCTLPPLDAGTYRVHVDAQPPVPLVVDAAGAEESCALRPHDLRHPVATHCSDDSECTATLVGTCNQMWFPSFLALRADDLDRYVQAVESDGYSCFVPSAEDPSRPPPDAGIPDTRCDQGTCRLR